MVVIHARDGYYMAYACNSDLGDDWDNAQAAIVVGELNALDWLITAELNPTYPKTERVNPMTAGHIPKRITSGKLEGRFASTHYLQTAILSYMVMGACNTTEGSPDDHDITKATTEAPVPFAVHLEKEGATKQLRWDLMGFIPRALDIYVSEKVPTATQIYSGVFAYTGHGAGDLAQPTALTQAALPPLNWFDTKHATSNTSFLYNTGAVNVDIVDVHLHFGWDSYLFGAYDASGFRTEGWVGPPFEAYAELGARRVDGAGTDIDEIVKLEHGSYAGDLDYILDFYRAADHRIDYTLDKMFIDEKSFVEVFASEGNWFEGVKFRLDFLDENSSLVIDEQNELNDDYYENG